MSHRFEDSFRAGRGWNCVPSWSCSKVVFKPVWHILVPSVKWINSWWWAEELPETCEFHARVNLENWCIWLVLLYKRWYTEDTNLLLSFLSKNLTRNAQVFYSVYSLMLTIYTVSTLVKAACRFCGRALGSNSDPH